MMVKIVIRKKYNKKKLYLHISLLYWNRTLFIKYLKSFLFNVGIRVQITSLQSVLINRLVHDDVPTICKGRIFEIIRYNRYNMGS